MNDVADLVAHRALVDRLARPEAWFEPVDGFERIETHISSVVLAGPYALKLKKPLRLDFLDFSTAALRRHSCDEELRINRRTAPQLYLRVVALTGSPQQPRIDGPGEPFEWGVLMRRFDNTGRLDRLAREQRLCGPQVDALAACIARMHGEEPASPAGFGEPAGVRRWAEDNLRELQQDGRGDEHGRLEDLARWTREAHAQLAPLMAQRRADGFVREGHGDLHLGNIVLLDGQPVPFDAIEFNPALRHLDVIDDVSFTFMDLWAHGRPDLAWRLISGYFAHTGDYGGAPLLRWYAVYRALVRAKVAGLRALQGGVDAAGARQLHLDLAERLQRAPQPWLVVTFGLSGSGKSTVAQLLVESLGAVCVRSDVERKRLFGLAPTERSADDAGLYGTEATARTYARLGEAAGALLRGRISAIVDAACLRRHERDGLRAVAARLGARCVIVECTAPDAVLRQRLVQRAAHGHDASDATLDVLRLQHRISEPLAADELADAVRIETDVPAPTLEQHCRRLVVAWMGASP
jgi:aminoglycoside phosphotransferase family enzyme/predicted kinase